MSINFRFFRSSGRAANGSSHYVRPVVNNVLTLNDLAERVESETSFSVSDVKGLVEAFQKYIAVELSLGHSVRIDGLGTFSSALSGKVERSKELYGSVESERRNTGRPYGHKSEHGDKLYRAGCGCHSSARNTDGV